jgi:hypothetical protein
VICAGCGLELSPKPSKRGRPTRFHDATCRQRAHRASLATRHHDLLSTLVTVESTISDIRRAILSGQEPSDNAGRRLQEATSEVLRQLDQTAPHTEQAITESVTIIASAPPEPPDVVTATSSHATENVTKRTARQRPRPKPRIARPAPLDLDTVRLARRGPQESGWRVLAGSDEEPIVVGFLEPVFSRTTGRRNGRWQAVTDHQHTLPGGPCRNRTDALVRLIDSYQRAAGK